MGLFLIFFVVKNGQLDDVFSNLSEEINLGVSL